MGTSVCGKVEIWAVIAPTNLLKNGVIRGDKYLAGTPCILRARYGQGDIIFYTFSPQFRNQQEGTYKLLLNTFYKEV